jgi:hypothetical protein
MKLFNKVLSVVAMAAAVAAMPAHAVVVSFGGQNTNVAGGDYSGLTSIYVPTSNMANPTSGLFIETFDAATALQGFGSPQTVSGGGISINATNTQSFNNPGTANDRTAGRASGCQVNSAGAVTIAASGQGFAVQQGTTSIAAAPGVPSAIGDSTCFGFGPGPGASAPINAAVKVDYTGFIGLLSGLGLAAANDSIGYLGVYYGSIDTYNDIRLYNGSSLAKYGTGILADGIIKGSEILAAMGGSTGNQSQVGSNVYVNLMFAPGETITAFEFTTTGIAYEFDNVVVGLASKNIPEPESLALVGLGLLGLAAARRRKAV